MPGSFERLTMDRNAIALPDRMIRLFSGRGATPVRDKTVTGLQGLQFPPVELRDYRFQLAFFDERLGGWIQDIVADVYDYYRRRDEGLHPLGLNFAGSLPTELGFDPRSEDDVPATLLLQQAQWQPNCYARRGTFHKFLAGTWRSFGIESDARVSATLDEIYLELRIYNRGDEELDWIVAADQKVLDHVKFDDFFRDRASHPDPFSVAYDGCLVSVASDLQVVPGSGWAWRIPGRSSATANVGIKIAVHDREQRSTGPELCHDTDLLNKAHEAARATRLRWSTAKKRLPTVRTECARLDEFYDRCLQTVLECRWERENFDVQPFYAVGSWLYTIA